MAYADGKYPLYSYTKDEKEEIRKEYGLNDSVLEDDIDAIIEWFEMQPHLAGAGIPNREFIERMLLFAKGSREKTKHRMDKYYRYSALAPELVQNLEDHIECDQKFYRLAVIPKLYNLKRITILTFNDVDPSKCFSDMMLRGCLLHTVLRLKYDYTIGDIWIIDFTNIGVSHLLRLNLPMTQRATQIFQDGIGVRIFGIHVLGAPFFVNQIISIFKRFVKQKIIERVVIHDSLDSIYKYIPKSHLPKEYGGEEWAFEEYEETYLKVVKSDDTRKALTMRNMQVSDESRRSRDCNSEEYIAGTFKKLEVD